MDCDGVIHQLSEFLDGELDPQLAQDLCRHLECCEECRVVVDTCRKTVQIYCRSEPLPLPANVRERLERVVAEKFKRRP